MRSEDRTTANPQRAARRTSTCTARALLLPRLTAATADKAARLRGMRAKALSCELHHDGLMQEACIHLYAEDAVIQFDIANLIVGDVINCYCSHNCWCPPSNQFLPGLTVFLITTKLFFGPGIAPLMRMMLRSASTRTTVRR